jgi:DNA-binding Xre family transcriptional regulator
MDKRKKAVSVSYNKLFKLLIDKKMKKTEFSSKAGISGATLAKLGNDEFVSLDNIGQICLRLGCTPSDILEFFPAESSGNGGTAE